jgi:hypothetical protein
MRDDDVNRALDEMQKATQAHAEDAIRAILDEKHPGKRYTLVVTARIAYTINWEPGQGL